MAIIEGFRVKNFGVIKDVRRFQKTSHKRL